MASFSAEVDFFLAGAEVVSAIAEVDIDGPE